MIKLSTLLISSLLMAPLISFSQNNDSSYKIEIINNNHKSLTNTLVDFKRPIFNQIDSSSYIENCIKEKSHIENNIADSNNGVNVTLDEKNSLLHIKFNKVLYIKKYLVGGCYIEEPVIGQYEFTQETPFILAEIKFNLTNLKTNQKDNAVYQLNISSQKN